jgi:hypothetical protein
MRRGWNGPFGLGRKSSASRRSHHSIRFLLPDVSHECVIGRRCHAGRGSIHIVLSRRMKKRTGAWILRAF